MIKLITSKLTINIKIYRDKNKNKNVGNETYYRIVGKKYLKIHLFKKKYNYNTKKFDKENIELLTTLFLNKFITYPKIFDQDNENLKKYLIENNVFSKEYFDIFNIDYGESEFVNELLKTMEPLNSVYYKTLRKIKSGVYLNINSILWNIYLCIFILSDIQDTINYEHHKYTMKNLKQLYFPYYKKEKANLIEKEFLKTMIITCDSCNDVLSKNLTTKFYGSPLYGDICVNCFNNKKADFYAKLSRYKDFMLLQGKKVMFQKELKKTKELLNNIKVKKLNAKSYNNLLKNVNKTILFNNNRKVCNICYDSLDFDNLGVYKKCGHTFHYSCMTHIGVNMCPLCREKTEFTKLYI